jgi:dihydroorotate dehydrogenase (NAD+) catalytic subunit
MIDLAPRTKRGLSLANPVMNASGVLGFARESRGVVDLSGLGAFVTNAVTARARAPAHPPNTVQLPNGVWVHTGLPNPGVSSAVRRYAPEWRRLGPPVIVHLAASTPQEVMQCVIQIEMADAVSAVELGLRDDLAAADLAPLVRSAGGSLPLIVRLPLERAVGLCTIAAAAGADALTVGAPPRRDLEVARGTVRGRIYGPEVFSASVEAVRAVTSCLGDPDFPVIGAGGLFSLESVREMLAAGAAAVQIDAVLWRNPDFVSQVAASADHGVDRLGAGPTSPAGSSPDRR